jgi:hypothetical protein
LRNYILNSSSGHSNMPEGTQALEKTRRQASQRRGITSRGARIDACWVISCVFWLAYFSAK